MEQLTMDGVDPVRNELEAAYRRWLETHPEVRKLIERFALEMAGKHRRFGVRLLTERVRWEVLTTWVEDEDGYKINNNFNAYLARDLIAKYPALEALIETRTIRIDGDDASNGDQ
jgi:hypothetical protein